MTDTAPLTVTVADADAGQSIAFVVEQLLGAASAAAVIAHGGVWMHGRRVGDSALPVLPGSAITLRRPPTGDYPDIAIIPSDILYEDDWLIALNKRAGWYSNATPWDIHGQALAALERLLLHRDVDNIPILHLAHRLDRDT